MWRYATFPVLYEMYRKLVFNNFSNFCLEYQNTFDKFLSGGSTDVVCKVWCKSVKLPVRSPKK